MSDQTAMLPAAPDPTAVTAQLPKAGPQPEPFVRALRAAQQQIVCPECGTPSPAQTDRRAASDFCPSCDYPLFWAPGNASVTQSRDTGTESLYRSPGASGTLAATTVPCPACGERNLPVDVDCVRCGAAMTPPPPPVVIAPPAPVPPPVVVVADPVPCTHPASWLVALVSATVTLALTLVVLWAW